MLHFRGYATLVASDTTLLCSTTFVQAPPAPQGLTYLDSTAYPGPSVSFKETTICETNEGVRGWSGCVNLPPSPQEGRNYPVHLWFWFFEARHDPQNAPLSLPALGQLLDRGVKVSLLYGYRDYQCNSSSISSSFSEVGYTKFETNASYTRGMTRQYGNLSFTRVFQAGHEVSYYQHETTYQISNRVIFDRDAATGRISTDSASNSSTYVTSGTSSALMSIGAPIEFESPVPSCYFWDIMETCTPEQAQLFANGSAITENFILVGYMLKNGTKVFYYQTGAAAGDNNGSTPQPYVPGSAALHTSTISLSLTALALGVVALIS